jgi:hypothetical protein
MFLMANRARGLEPAQRNRRHRSLRTVIRFGKHRHLGFRENQYLIVLVIMLGMLLLRLLSTRRFDFSAREGMREPAEILLMGGTIFIVFIFPVSQFIYFQF